MLDQPDITLQPEQPDIVLAQDTPEHDHAAMHEEPIHQPQSPPEQPTPEPVRVSIDTLPSETRRSSITAFVISLVSFLLVTLAFFIKIQTIFLISVAGAALGITLSVYAQATKKPGQNYSAAGLIIGGLALLSAIVIFVQSFVALPA